MRLPRLSRIHLTEITFKGGAQIQDWFQTINLSKTENGKITELRWYLDRSTNQILQIKLDEIVCIRTIKTHICIRVRDA